MEKSLQSLQRLLYKAITAPEPAGTPAHALGRGLAASRLEAIIAGDERLSAAERLAIYANAYFYRLLECLRDDFPATATIAGAERFLELIRDYLAAYPPSHHSVTYAGRFLADFLCNYHGVQQYPFIADVARLEWTLIEAFQARDAVALKAEVLRAIAPERWPELRFKTPPALSVIDCRWRVTELLRAVQEGNEWRPPEATSQNVVVWRQDATVYYREITRRERDAFSLLAQGSSFAVLCERIAGTRADSKAVQEINRMIERWLADGCLMLDDGAAPARAKAAAKRPPDGPTT
jgi:hypothetical protein